MSENVGRAALPPRAMTALQRWFLLLIVLLALAVRLYRLDGQSLWYDEGTSVALAQSSVSTIIQSAAADIHPPLYYLALHAWVRVFGASEIAVRLLSVLAGALLVYVIFVLTRRWFGPPAGLLATTLAALSPLLVYYSQETRMYMLAALLGAVSVALLPSAPAPPGKRRAHLWRWIGYVLATVAALYTHYFAATVALAQSAALGLSLFRRREQWPRRLAPALAAQALVGLLYLPWLPVMAAQFRDWPAISEFYTLPALIGRIFAIFSLGLSMAPEQATLVLAAFAVVLVLGVLPLRRTALKEQSADDSISRLLLAVSWLAVPVLTMFLLSLRRPLYNPKFLLVAVPAFYILLGRGLTVLAGGAPEFRTLRRVRNSGAAARLLVGLGAFALLAGGSVLSLGNYYGDARYGRDNYRGIVQAIAGSERAGDGVILNAPGQTDIFGYYYRGSLPIYLLPRQRPLDEQATKDELARIAAKHGRVWVVYYGDGQADPQRVIESWLYEHAFKASDAWYGNLRLAQYAFGNQAGGQQQTVNARIGPHVTLVGYQLGRAQVAAGDILPLTLFWQTDAVLSERYTVFAHIINRHESLWGQRDSEPGSGLRPTTTWQPGETIQDNIGLPVLSGAPPGQYQIEIGLYLPDTGQRLPISDSAGRPLGDRILIGPVAIDRPPAPPPLDALGLHNKSGAVISGLRLLGYNLTKLGHDEATTSFARTDVLHASLFWQVASAPLPDLTMTVQVIDARNQVVLRAGGPAEGDYATPLWGPGEVVRDQYRLHLGGLAAGEYRLAVDLRDAGGRALGTIALGRITVR